MGVKNYNPTSAGRRNMSALDHTEISTKRKPGKKFLRSIKSTGGRNANGRITSRRRGGGHKKLYRIVDFKRDKLEVPGKVASIEYDPNRNARIALIHYRDGEKRYIIAPDKLKIGDTIVSSSKEADARPGNSMPLRFIPVGSFIHNVELKIGKGGQLARAAAAGVQLLGKEGDHATVRMPSGEIRLIHLDCRATVGQVGNSDFANVRVGKAGKSRWLGRRPKVRGVVMNPVDHPHGGGEGKTSGGRHPVSPWGLPTKGYKTRNNKRTNRFRVRRRQK